MGGDVLFLLGVGALLVFGIVRLARWGWPR